MKTHTIKTPTAELLIIELHEGTADFSVMNTGDRLAVCAFDENDHCLGVKGISKDYTLLGKPDEIREDDAAQLIPMYFDHEKTAVEYLIEMIESEIYWDVNPFGEKPVFDYDFPEDGPSESMYESAVDDFDMSSIKWHEAEQKTFDRNRSIIFKKVTRKI